MNTHRDEGQHRQMTRRVLLMAGATGIMIGAARVTHAARHTDEEGVTAPEDLMKEHGVLNRCLLVYEEGIRRLQAHAEVGPQVFHQAADLVRRFVEAYHERNEEKYIFPVFQKAGKLTDLVATLLTQHKAGRAVTAEILRLSEPSAFQNPDAQGRLVAACQQFIRMYRPHKAREDTVLFPALRTILAPKQVEALGARMEADEKKVLGAEGFEKAVAEVARLEQTLGIADLAQFTPHG
jgi:hemerythrin-like domain-containing protein